MKHLSSFPDFAMDSLSESQSDDYRQSAPRKQILGRIAKSFRPGMMAPGGKRRKGPDASEEGNPVRTDYSQYYPGVDEFLSRFQRYERTFSDAGTDVTETYYHNEISIYLKATNYAGPREGELVITPTKLLELRRFLGLNEEACITTLRGRFGVVSVDMRQPFETVSDIRRMKSPIPARVGPATPDLPYDRIKAELIEKYSLGMVEFTVTERNKYDKTKTDEVRYEAFYSPSMEIIATITRHEDRLRDYLRVAEGFYVDALRHVEENYQRKLGYGEAELFFNRLFGSKSMGIYYNLSHPKYVSLRNKMVRAIKSQKK